MRYLEMRIRHRHLPVLAVLFSEYSKGYVYIEAPNTVVVQELIQGLWKLVRQQLPGKVDVIEIEKFVIRKTLIEELQIGQIVEIISGPFRDFKAKITAINTDKEELTVELLEVERSIPITLKADYVKPSRKLQAKHL